ncbi:hypothetical protein [Cellulomonas endometrii]|uniref:hypothetical protein n=1 Tax=Cellulomonas endometrii TaxID=3036301 RepID=UPI0024ADC330|nr:hypothetical protein [Cellulomonas endometrii]
METRIEGSPASIREVAAWLLDTVSAAGADLDDDVYQQYRRVPEIWDGEGAEGMRGRLSTLAGGGSTVSSAASATGRELESLASALELSQADMETVRERAASGGLRVVGTVVHGPGDPPPDVAALPVDATAAQAQAYQQGVAAIQAYDALVAVWQEITELAASAQERWEAAVESAAATWSQNRGNVTSVFTDLMSNGVSAAARGAVAFNAAQLRAFHLDSAAAYDAHVRAVTGPDGRITTTRGHFYDLLDTGTQHADDAARLGGQVRSPEVAARLSRGLLALGVVATGYSIYDDIQNGESPAQAAVSNGVGFAASIGAGAAIGAGIGSIVPVGGTIVGGVVGAAAGTVVGLITSGAIDSMWENGVDSIGDVGNAIADGWDEMTSTFTDAGSMIGDAAGAVGGGIKDAWDAIF